MGALNKADLREFATLLARADAVEAMRAVGACGDSTIGLRHDVDDNAGSLGTAIKMARWEHERGYRSTYFLLHTAWYWRAPYFAKAVEKIQAYGHEIGIHADAIGEALITGEAPALILRRALRQLRELAPVIGVVAHGNKSCYHTDGTLRYVNDEMFTECARPEVGAPNRELSSKVRLEPEPLAAFGLEYESYRIPHRRYISDSGGMWSIPPSKADGPGQLHILQHPDWWKEAFA